MKRKPWVKLTKLREARGMSKYRLSKTSGVSQVKNHFQQKVTS